MNDSVSIHSKGFLGEYIATQRFRAETFEDADFLIGFASAWVLPQVIYCFYGGNIAMIAFAIVALVGTGLGLAKYFSTDQDPLTSSRHPVRPVRGRSRKFA